MHLPLANRRHVVLAAIGTGVQDRKAASMTLEVPKNLTQFPATSSWPESERRWLQNPSIQWDECSHSVHMHCANSFAFNAISLAHRTLACTSAGHIIPEKCPANVSLIATSSAPRVSRILLLLLLLVVAPNGIRSTKSERKRKKLTLWDFSEFHYNVTPAILFFSPHVLGSLRTLFYANFGALDKGCGKMGWNWTLKISMEINLC